VTNLDMGKTGKVSFNEKGTEGPRVLVGAPRVRVVDFWPFLRVDRPEVNLDLLFGIKVQLKSLEMGLIEHFPHE